MVWLMEQRVMLATAHSSAPALQGQPGTVWLKVASCSRLETACDPAAVPRGFLPLD
jgi:hypothetical protein